MNTARDVILAALKLDTHVFTNELLADLIVHRLIEEGWLNSENAALRAEVEYEPRRV